MQPKEEVRGNPGEKLTEEEKKRRY
jgi:hypothetical protein